MVLKILILINKWIVIGFKIKFSYILFATEFHVFDRLMSKMISFLSMYYDHGGLKTYGDFYINHGWHDNDDRNYYWVFVRCIDPRCQAYRCFQFSHWLKFSFRLQIQFSTLRLIKNLIVTIMENWQFRSWLS